MSVWISLPFSFFSHSEFLRIRNQIRSRRCDWLACLSHLFQTAGSSHPPSPLSLFLSLMKKQGHWSRTLSHGLSSQIAFPWCLLRPLPWRSVNQFSDLELWSDSGPMPFFFLAISGLSWSMQDCSLCYMGFSSCGIQAQLPQGMWDLVSPARDQTHIPWTGRGILNHWTTREVP